MTPEQVLAQALEDDWLDIGPGTCREIAQFQLRRLAAAGFEIRPVETE